MNRIEKLESLKKMYETYRKVAFKHVLEYYIEYMLMDPFEVIEDYHLYFKHKEFDANCLECYSALSIMKDCMDSIIKMMKDKFYSEHKYDYKSFVEDEEVFEYLIKLFYDGKKEYICRKHNKSLPDVEEVDNEGYEINDREIATSIVEKLGIEYDTEARGLLRGLIYVMKRN